MVVAKLITWWTGGVCGSGMFDRVSEREREREREKEADESQARTAGRYVGE